MGEKWREEREGGRAGVVDRRKVRGEGRCRDKRQGRGERDGGGEVGGVGG